jgi:hypothetical protein
VSPTAEMPPSCYYLVIQMKKLIAAGFGVVSAVALVSPAFAGVKCYSVFNINTGRLETVCVTSSVVETPDFEVKQDSGKDGGIRGSGR